MAAGTADAGETGLGFLRTRRGAGAAGLRATVARFALGFAGWRVGLPATSSFCRRDLSALRASLAIFLACLNRRRASFNSALAARARLRMDSACRLASEIGRAHV